MINKALQGGLAVLLWCRYCFVAGCAWVCLVSRGVVVGDLVFSVVFRKGIIYQLSGGMDLIRPRAKSLALP
jgi:hypothetical protein